MSAAPGRARRVLQLSQVAERLECDTKTVDNALQRVKRKVGAHLTSRDAQVQFSKMSGMLPARVDAASDASLMANPHYAQFIAQVKNGRP